MARTPPPDHITGLILEVFQLNGRLLSAGDALTRPLDQTSARWQVLGAIDQDARTVAGIARRMGLTRQSVQRTADRLEADGLLSYAANPAHQRARLAALTTAGRETLEAISSRQQRWARQITQGLHDAGVHVEELQLAVRTLQRVREAIDGTPLPGGKAAPASSRRTRARATRRRSA